MALALLVGASAGPTSTVFAQPKPGVTVVGEIPFLLIDQSGSGEVWILLRNQTDKEAKYQLTLGNFVRKTGSRVLSARPSFFKGTETTGAAFLEGPLAAGANQRVKLQLSNYQEAEGAEAPLLLDSLRYTVRAVRYDVPFTVSVQSASADKPRIALSRDKGGVVLLRNDDSMAYPVVWRLVLGDERLVQKGVATLPARSAAVVGIDAPREWYRKRFESFFKTEQRPGFLSVQLGRDTAATAADGSLKTFPVDLDLSYWSAGMMGVVGSGIVLIILLVGGATSLLVGLWIPNKRMRIRLAGRLDEVENTMRAISSDTDSMLRVSVRVERMRILAMLRGLNAWSPDSTDRMNQLEKQIETLAKRVKVADELDEGTRTLAVLRTRTSGVPPTILKQVARSLEDVTRLLGQSAPTDADLQAAETAIRAASERLGDTIPDDTEFATVLADRVKALRQDYATTKLAGRPTFQRLQPKLGDLLDVLGDQALEDPLNVTAKKYFWIDISTQKLFILQHYILRLDGAAADPGRQKLIALREDPLLTYLRLQSADALALADRVQKQIEENVFSEDIVKAIEANQFRVKRDPITVSANSPMLLAVELSDSALRGRTAQYDIDCVWKFAEGVGDEHGWQIVHYFRNQDEAKYQVQFQTQDGKALHKQTDKTPIEVSETLSLRPLPKDQRRERFKVEILQLSVALSIAVLALLAGARDQLMKLDIVPGLVAVFLLGFGADAVKNLFAKR